MWGVTSYLMKSVSGSSTTDRDANSPPGFTADPHPPPPPRPESFTPVVPLNEHHSAAGTTPEKTRSNSAEDSFKLFGARALAAGGMAPMASPGRLSAPAGRRGGALDLHVPPASHLSTHTPKFLVLGDGLMAPFMALCLRVHGVPCDLAYYPSHHPIDRGTLVFTPSMTQLLGDVLNVSVPSGSVIGRILTFDHVGNDMCDLDLNDFRERGESPTFYCCEKAKVTAALLSLCRVGNHSCHVWSDALLHGNTTQHSTSPGIGSSFPYGHAASSAHPCSFEALENGGVRVRFSQGSGLSQDYMAVICTARNAALIPELTVSREELQQRAENTEKYKESYSKAPRWVEMCVPPLPELKPFEKRFTPGSQEIVEILTPRDAKLTVRPTMLTTKLFYHVTMSIPESTADPSLRSTSTKLFWDEVASHWTAGVPGYISHTLFRPLLTHMQQHFSKQNVLVYKTPFCLMPHWTEGDGRIIKVAHAAHAACFDAIDVNEAQGFTDCFGLARVLAEVTGPTMNSMGADSGAPLHYSSVMKGDVASFLAERRLQVMAELEHHARLLQYGLSERNQIGFLRARFGMKIMRRYKKSWSALLKNYITLLPKKP